MNARRFSSAVSFAVKLYTRMKVRARFKGGRGDEFTFERVFFFLPSICTRQLPSSRSLACYARLVNKFYRPRWQSSRMTQAFAPASLISITIGRLQSSPINVRFIFKQWNRLYDDLIRFDRAPIALLLSRYRIVIHSHLAIY